MRHLVLSIVAATLAVSPLCAQSRHRGYNANGGWHQKAPVPVAAHHPAMRKEKLPKNKTAKPQPVVPPPQKY